MALWGGGVTRSGNFLKPASSAMEGEVLGEQKDLSGFPSQGSIAFQPWIQNAKS